MSSSKECAEECQQPLEAGKVKKMRSPLEHGLADILILA